jgi:hypothetical protein
VLPSKRQQSCQALPLSENRCKLLADLPRWPLLTAARCAGSSFVAHHHCLVYGRVARPFMGGCKVRASKAFQRQAGTKVIYLDPDGLRRLLPVVEEWSATLTEIQRRRLNHRSTALRNYRATAVGPAPDSIISGFTYTITNTMVRRAVSQHKGPVGWTRPGPLTPLTGRRLESQDGELSAAT